MRILFAGTPEIAVVPLESINEKFDIVAILTAPDKGRGRGRRVSFSPVKKRAIDLGLKILQPKSLGDPDFLFQIKELKPELLVVVAFGKIFRREFMDLFPMGGINMHPSLLPKYRGPAPIPAVILAGEKETGVTVQRLAMEVDSGDILAVRKILLTGRETTASLSYESSRIGAELLLSVIERMERGEVWGVPQREDEATYCKKVKKEDGLIRWGKSAIEIDRMVRAYFPWPNAYTYMGGELLKILAGSVPDRKNLLETELSNTLPGTVLGTLENYGILVKTGKGVYCIEKLQLQYKKPNNWKAFLNGHPEVLESVLGGSK